MIKLTLTEALEMLQNTELWTVTKTFQVFDVAPRMQEIFCDDHSTHEEIMQVFGEGEVLAVNGDIKIRYTESWSYDQDDKDSLHMEMLDSDALQIEGAELVDEDGDSLDFSQEMWHEWYNLPKVFSDVDYSSVMESNVWFLNKC